jgi:hypothetical protein
MMDRLRLVPILALLALVAGPALAADSPAAGKADAPAVRTARVAQGGTVTLAAPALSREQLAARRPHFEDLRPRARTNKE